MEVTGCLSSPSLFPHFTWEETRLGSQGLTGRAGADLEPHFCCSTASHVGLVWMCGAGVMVTVSPWLPLVCVVFRQLSDTSSFPALHRVSLLLWNRALLGPMVSPMVWVGRTLMCVLIPTEGPVAYWELAVAPEPLELFLALVFLAFCLLARFNRL